MGSTLTAGSQNFTGSLTLNQNLTVISQMTTADTAGVAITGAISGAGGLQINGTVKSSGASIDTAGIVKLSGTNTFTGDTRVYKRYAAAGCNLGIELSGPQTAREPGLGRLRSRGFGLTSSTTITSATLVGLSGTVI